MPFSTPFTPRWLRKVRTSGFLNQICDNREIGTCECCGRLFESNDYREVCDECYNEEVYLTELVCGY